MNTKPKILGRKSILSLLVASAALSGCNFEEPVSLGDTSSGTSSNNSSQTTDSSTDTTSDNSTANDQNSTGSNTDSTGDTTTGGSATDTGNTNTHNDGTNNDGGAAPPNDNSDNSNTDNTGGGTDQSSSITTIQPKPPEAPAKNFAVNGDVETDLSHWGVTSGNLQRSTSVSHSGSASAVIVNRNATWHGLTFNVGKLTEGNEYDVSVWVKLAEGVHDTSVTLTAKRLNDSDDSTYNEYTSIVTVTAKAGEWTQVTGFYTQSGTPFEHFIIETQADANVSFYADDFAITGTVIDEPTPTPSADFFVGNITTSGAVRSDFIQYWNQITPENEGKWETVERTRDVYSWSGVDAVYNYAKANNIPFKQHTFVWGKQYPNWIMLLAPSEQAAEIEQWIAAFCERYPDTQMIDVVNEATPGHAPATFARNAFGNDWIIKSFQLARKYCPNAKLILNDYNVLSWSTDQFIEMAKPAINAGVVDGIGLQSHGLEDTSRWSAAVLKVKLDKLATLGVPIYISEYDIKQTNDQTQLAIMKEQFPVFYNHPAVKGITLWGYVSGRTWRNGTGLISEGGTPRPAMTWLVNYLQQNPKN